MNITKELLDTPFYKVFENAENEETPREFIRSSEKEFGMKKADVVSMSEDELNAYIEFLDYLWERQCGG